ncbi:hypothetical protein [Actinomadura sp. HBU206391]|uniref:hypothetical protein n=1 Tax=Actinomadura sp. HBU206391 TaxID=2731692 RepID=UPI00164FB8E3|nr:hypothetical protein [Actinomadura sp. HBU206391]MBC6456834.1 hypothetical protein [Actinomadura sp. HBU206391]
MAVAALAGVGLATVPSAAHAQVVSVACNTPALLAAITAANAAASQTLRLATNCTYDLTAAAQVGTRGPNGLPIITGNITMLGRNTTIRRNAVALFRIVEVAAGAGLSLRGITLTGGDGGVNTGGAILNARGRVLLFQSLVFGNSADNGGGISNDSGSLRLVSSTVRNNTTDTGGGGGGIYNDGALLVRFSRVNSNRANTSGGGIYNELGGRAQLFRSDVIGNIAVVNGGGFYNGAGGNVRGDLVRISFNGAVSGGGVFNAASAGNAAFTRSAVVQNNPNNCVPLGTVPGCVG